MLAWYRGTEMVGYIGDADCPANLKEAATCEAEHVAFAHRRRLQTSVCPSSGEWLCLDGAPPELEAAYRCVVRRLAEDPSF